jgi:hypothetical protein
MCEATKNIVIEHMYGASTEPYRIKLEKNTKGFNYEISVAGADLKEVIARLDEAQEIMHAKYGSA